METDKILKANRMIEFFVNHYSPITNQQSSLDNHQSNGVRDWWNPALLLFITRA